MGLKFNHVFISAAMVMGISFFAHDARGDSSQQQLNQAISQCGSNETCIINALSLSSAQSPDPSAGTGNSPKQQLTRALAQCNDDSTCVLNAVSQYNTQVSNPGANSPASPPLASGPGVPAVAAGESYQQSIADCNGDATCVLNTQSLFNNGNSAQNAALLGWATDANAASLNSGQNGDSYSPGQISQLEGMMSTGTMSADVFNVAKCVMTTWYPSQQQAQQQANGSATGSTEPCTYVNPPTGEVASAGAQCGGAPSTGTGQAAAGAPCPSYVSNSVAQQFAPIYQLSQYTDFPDQQQTGASAQ